MRNNTTRLFQRQLGLATLMAMAVAGWSGGAIAADAEVGVDSAELDAGNGDAADLDSSAFLAAGKVGGLVPFNDLSPFVNFGVELGWVFGGTKRKLGALLDITYTAPKADGSQAESNFDPPRVAGATYNWKLTQKQLVLQPTFLYRFTGLSEAFTPYAGIGPRIYFLESVVEGDVGGTALGETQERSMKFGAGLPLGVEYKLGPGGLFAELLFQWGPLDHDVTGDSSLTSGTLFLGYRALL